MVVQLLAVDLDGKIVAVQARELSTVAFEPRTKLSEAVVELIFHVDTFESSADMIAIELFASVLDDKALRPAVERVD